MGLLFKVILALFIGGIFIGIFISSFFSSPDYLTIPELVNISDIPAITTDGEENNIEENILGDFETIFSNGQKPTITFGTGSIDVNISDGKFVSSFRDIGKRYSFSGNGYHIEQEGIGEILFDTTSVPGKVFVMPLNTSAHVSLINADATETYTNIFLSPHMYLEFTPARGKFLTNADVIRVETIYTLGYFPEPISQMGSDVFLKKYSEVSDNFFPRSIEYITQKDKEIQKMLYSFDDQSVGKFPGSDTIQRYFHLFVNDEKKEIFYKNLILEGLLHILHSQKYDIQDIETIKKDFEKLKKLNIESYNDLQKMQQQMSALVYTHHGVEYVIPKLSFATLSDIEKSMDSLYFPLYGFALFTLYDISEKFSDELLRNFLQAFGPFVGSSDESSEIKHLRYQYFAYFLEAQLGFLLESSDGGENISSIINTLSNYTEIEPFSYSNGVTSRITSLYVYGKILSQIDAFLRTRYFTLARNESNLLLLHPENRLTAEEISNLKQLLEGIFTKYQQDENFLDDTNARDQAIKKDITLFTTRIEEYFGALENYESYVSQYDISKKNLLNIDVFGTGNELQLSEENLIQYLSQFSGFSLETMKVEIIDEYYYTVRDVMIAGQSFSFDLYPFSSYKMTNIVFDNTPLKFEYKLDEIESQWQERYKTASETEKDSLDFKRFFLITFFSNHNSSGEIYVEDTIKIGEDKTEIVFKRDKLLGNKGEFYSLRHILPIEYENIKLVKNESGYDIFIENAPILIQSGGDTKKKSYSGLFSSEYVLNQSDHYFTESSIRVKNASQNNVDNFSFSGNVIDIIGRIQLADFHSRMVPFFDAVENYQRVYDAVEQKYPESTPTLGYTLYNKKMTLKFDSRGKKYTILISGDNVEAIYGGTSQLLKQKVNVAKIGNYLP